MSQQGIPEDKGPFPQVLQLPSPSQAPRTHDSSASLPALLAGQGSGVPPLPHQGSGASLLHQASATPPLQHQGSGIPRQGSSASLMHQGSGVPLLQHQGSQSLADWAASAVASPASVTPHSARKRLPFGPPPSPVLEPEHGGAGAAAAKPGVEAAAAAAAEAAEGGMAAGEVPPAGSDGSSEVALLGDADLAEDQQDVAPQRRRCRSADPPVLDQPSAAAYLRMAAWVAVLFVGYGFQRGLCAAGIPYDCDAPAAEEAFATLSLLAFIGGGMGWLAGVTRPARFAWLAAPRRAYLWLTYLAVLPAYSGVSSIPALRVSLTGIGAWGPVPIVVKVVALLLVAASLAFHVRLAWRAGAASADQLAASAKPGAVPAQISSAAVMPVVPDSPHKGSSSDDSSSSGSSVSGDSTPARSTPASSPCKPAKTPGGVDSARSAGGRSGHSAGVEAGATAAAAAAAAARRAAATRRQQRAASWRSVGAYLLPRLAVLLYFAVWLASMAGSGKFDLHVHHYALGWAVAIFAAFNHPVSGIVLSLATAVFVQGAGAYGFDPMFKPADAHGTGCLTVSSPPTGQMTCAFWSATPFDIGFCSNTSWIPWFDCNVSWPWPETAITRATSNKRIANITRSAPKALSVLDEFAELADTKPLTWSAVPLQPLPV